MFFPEGVFDPTNARLDAIRRGWYAGALDAMGELPLSCAAIHTKEVYRFLWLRTFDPPISIRLEGRDSEGWLSARRLNGRGGYEPGTLVEAVERHLTEELWAEALDRLEAADFWNLPGPQPTVGTDGARWIVEAQAEDRYHAVDRWSPRVAGEGSRFRQVGLHWLRLAEEVGMELGRVY